MVKSQNTARSLGTTLGLAVGAFLFGSLYVGSHGWFWFSHTIIAFGLPVITTVIGRFIGNRIILKKEINIGLDIGVPSVIFALFLPAIALHIFLRIQLSGVPEYPGARIIQNLDFLNISSETYHISKMYEIEGSIRDEAIEFYSTELPKFGWEGDFNPTIISKYGADGWFKKNDDSLLVEIETNVPPMRESSKVKSNPNNTYITIVYFWDYFFPLLD